MSKLWSYCMFVVLAIFAAGVFGALHDQISYTVSSEYFTRFKFYQFQLLDSAIPERIRVAQVGVLGSWWMGIPLGMLTGAAGFIHLTSVQMRKALFWSLPLIVGFTLVFALCGLLYGFFQTQTIKPSLYTRWFIPEGVENLRAYLCVGYMHNAAYLGGYMAIPVAWFFHFAFKYRISNRS
ncbi:MAG: hypothetical protein PHR16_02580 [Methylovulum sp.]|nr:hypothetical protein [Methylovulum sp.]